MRIHVFVVLWQFQGKRQYFSYNYIFSSHTHSFTAPFSVNVSLNTAVPFSTIQLPASIEYNPFLVSPNMTSLFNDSPIFFTQPRYNTHFRIIKPYKTCLYFGTCVCVCFLPGQGQLISASYHHLLSLMMLDSLTGKAIDADNNVSRNNSRHLRFSSRSDLHTQTHTEADMCKCTNAQAGEDTEEVKPSKQYK